MIYLYIACGGALGACLRFYLMQLSLSILGKGFPFGTLMVNILGSLAIGLTYALIEKEWLNSDPWRMFILVGLLGSLTTFSTFSLDNLLLIQQGQAVKAGINIILNVVVCLIVAYVGTQLVNLRQ